VRDSGTAIPIRLAWSSPFVRWQGALGDVSSLDLAIDVTQRALKALDFPAIEVDTVTLGWTVPQPEIFYGAPTVSARIGAEHTTGPMVSQACATAAVALELAQLRVASGLDQLGLVLTTDRTSNGPVLTYPRPSAPGGAPLTENWVLDSFARDPVGNLAMVDTAEAVATERGITREELDDVTVMRYEQYTSSLADDRDFQRRYMVPAHVPRRRQDPLVVDSDQGVTPTTTGGLAQLVPVSPTGVVTHGTQTHPADGTAGMVVTTLDRARALANGQGVAHILGTGRSRVRAARMPEAPVPAAKAALKAANLSIADIDVVTTHNPFAVNDIVFHHEFAFPLERMNPRGSSLIYGHPQGPTGARLMIELMHCLVERGGGIGLFTGCAAGDTGAAVVLRVDDR